ncbi:histidinol-phosphate transaminase [Methanospirillum hungatei]|uniref:histidinol-phosphate transaminase n=1 Tax=Methanospirillum hungatei TaxID=2203 RepID=UPI001B70786B|nr:histidinol-phosphate transaminase [Methanospirillum hungatei]MBP9008050.1 histidinol-phosphate transaminase [Methanospirillum sp.]HOW05801.1 histidinol-phosphate transaminase [Methanospirillum hungatei]
MQQSNRSADLIRDLYRQDTGYVFAKKPEEIAKEFGFAEVARLASNENPFGPSPRALKEAEKALCSMHRYPDTTHTNLISALRRYHGDYSFVTGVGMDGVIETCIRVLINPGDQVAISTPTFSFYGLAAATQGGDVTHIPRNPDFSVDIPDFIAAARKAKISFLCTPNNPSGTVTPLSDIEEILKNIDGILFLDNAYVEFSPLDYRDLMNRYDTLIIGRTMSKVFGLAGCRVGYAFVPDWFRPVYEKAATPFTLNTISAAAAAGALEDHDYIDRTIAYVKKWRDIFTKEIGKTVLPSGANFVMIDVAPLTGDQATDFFAQNGVLVRSCRSFPGLADHYIRVCIGEEWENNRFIEVFRRL